VLRLPIASGHIMPPNCSAACHHIPGRQDPRPQVQSGSRMVAIGVRAAEMDRAPKSAKPSLDNGETQEPIPTLMALTEYPTFQFGKNCHEFPVEQVTPLPERILRR
jgi:hypothetical protein